MKITIKVVEAAFNIKIKLNYISLGVDTASRSGICIAKTDKTNIELDYSFLDISTTNKYHKYNTIVNHFNTLIEQHNIDTIVIEETFFSRNPKVFQFLSRIGGLVYAVAHLRKIVDKIFISAVQARKALGLPSNKKKEEVHAAFHKALTTVTITDVDIIDAIVLALNGLIEPKGLLNEDESTG